MTPYYSRDGVTIYHNDCLKVLPELETDENASTYCRLHLGIHTNLPTSLPSLDHQFTHYKLRIHPQFLQVISPSMIKVPQTTWVKPRDALKYAIPTPVRKLLEKHFLTDNTHFNYPIIDKKNA